MNKNEAINNLKCINQCVNIFDIISFREEQASQVLAWLLNPLESHGLETKVLEYFLNHLSENGKINCFVGKNSKKVPVSEITDIEKLEDKIIVQTEYSTAKGRPDILVVIENKTKNYAGYLIIIENKYGSKENNKQTKKYFKDFSRKEFEKYKTVYVYMDINMDVKENFVFPLDKFKDNKHKELNEIADKDHWYGCNYNWIIKFLDPNNVNNFSVNKSTYKILHDIYIEFSGEYEVGETYFKDFYDNVPNLLKCFEDKIKTFKKDVAGKKYVPGKSSKYIEFYQLAGAYNTLIQYSKFYPMVKKLEEQGYDVCCTEKNLYLNMINMEEKRKKLNKNSSAFHVNVCLQKGILYIWLYCSSEYAKGKNSKIVTALCKCNDFPERNKNNVKKWFDEKTQIHHVRLKSEKIEQFDFSEVKMKDAIKKIKKMAEYFNDLDRIYFSKKGK